MPLPKKLDESIRKQFEELIEFGEGISIRQDPISLENIPTSTKEGSFFGSRWKVSSISEFNEFRTRMKSLIQRILAGQRLKETLNDVRTLEKRTDDGVLLQELLGTLKGLKKEYESGMLDSLSNRIETNVNYDFMSQAEQLLGGKRHDFDHVPAAVLCGAVLEDALRRLCQRQEPKINTEFRGNPKMLDRLINDLQNGDVYSKPVAAQLRSWAAIRNSAAHGKFDEVKRSAVEQMIPGVRDVLADYL